MARGQARRNGVVAIAALVFATQSALVARQDDVRIHGRVVTESGAPVRGATVHLQLHPANRTWTITTDENGVFEARGLPSGSYSIRVLKAGFLTSPSPEGPELPVIAKAGETKDTRDIVLRRGGAIAGRVLDGFGEPIQGAPVAASRIVYSPPGTKSIYPVKTAVTNDLGEYRLFGLEPGTYFVSAGGSVPTVVPGGAGPVVPIMRSEAGFTFYASARLTSDAQAIRLGPAEQRLGVDIAFAPTPLWRVSGRVVTSNGLPARDVSVYLGASQGTAPDLSPPKRGMTDANGVFSIAGVATGQYFAFAATNAYLEQVGQTGSTRVPAAVETGSASVNVAGDVSGIEIGLSRGFEIRGRILIDGAPPAPTNDRRLVQVSSVDQLEGPVHAHGSLIDAQGNFVVSGRPGGRVVLSVIGLPAGAMLSRVTFNGMDVTDEGFEISGPGSGVVVAVTTQPAVVTGVLTLPTGEAAVGAVLVFSENERFWTLPHTRHLRMTSAALKTGEFRVNGLPSGRYLAVAPRLVDPLTWADPENLKELRKVATPFVVPETGTVTVKLVRR